VSDYGWLNPLAQDRDSWHLLRDDVFEVGIIKVSREYVHTRIAAQRVIQARTDELIDTADYDGDGTADARTLPHRGTLASPLQRSGGAIKRRRGTVMVMT